MKRVLVAGLLAVLGAGRAAAQAVVVPVPCDALPDFAADDLDRASLRTALAESRRVLSLPEGERARPLAFGGAGGIAVTRSDLRATLDALEPLLDLPPDRLAAAVASTFACFRSAGNDGKGTVLFTSYHSPSYEGSLTRTERCRFPLRRAPEELTRGTPFWTRRQIEGEGKLDGRGLEVAWFARRLDPYLMEVQGSGAVRLADGSLQRLQCSVSNGHPYVSLGKELVKDGKLPKDAVSIPAIRAFLDEHPELLDEYLFRNPSYVFFERTSEAPRGCTGVHVTAGRSIATDKRLFPGGALAFVVVEMPVVSKGQVVRWERRARFVLDDDTGGAIRGAGRVDLYAGEDADAEAFAGVMKRDGALYYLLRRHAP